MQLHVADSAYIQEKDAEYMEYRYKKGGKSLLNLYTRLTMPAKL